MNSKQVIKLIQNIGEPLRTVEIAKLSNTSVKSAQKGVSEGLANGSLLEIRNSTDRRFKSYKVI